MAEKIKQLERMYTTDPLSTRFHVVQWGVLGDTWPYFKPDFHACQQYVSHYNEMLLAKKDSASAGTNGAAAGTNSAAAGTSAVSAVPAAVERVTGIVPTGWVVNKHHTYPPAVRGGAKREHVIYQVF
jgi:hypothetical protein